MLTPLIWNSRSTDNVKAVIRTNSQNALTMTPATVSDYFNIHMNTITRVAHLYLKTTSEHCHISHTHLLFISSVEVCYYFQTTSTPSIYKIRINNTHHLLYTNIDTSNIAQRHISTNHCIYTISLCHVFCGWSFAIGN